MECLRMWVFCFSSLAFRSGICSGMLFVCFCVRCLFFILGLEVGNFFCDAFCMCLCVRCLLFFIIGLQVRNLFCDALCLLLCALSLWFVDKTVSRQRFSGNSTRTDKWSVLQCFMFDCVCVRCLPGSLMHFSKCSCLCVFVSGSFATICRNMNPANLHQYQVFLAVHSRIPSNIALSGVCSSATSPSRALRNVFYVFKIGCLRIHNKCSSS